MVNGELIKSCPFCGGKAKMLNYSENEWLICCTECDGMVERWRKTEEEAIEQWNRRAQEEKSVGAKTDSF